MASYRIQESKEARRSIHCMVLGCMMICAKKVRGAEGDQIKFNDSRFERWQVVGFRKARRRMKEEFQNSKSQDINKRASRLRLSYLNVVWSRVPPPPTQTRSATGLDCSLQLG